jgi:hypothetical protein
MRVRCLGRAAVATIVAGGILFGAWAFAQSPPAAESAARASIRAQGLQTELPRAQPAKTLPDLQIPIELVWLILICVAAILLYALRDLLPFRRRGWEEEISPGLAAAGANPADALSTADELSRYGRFVEAMHMLLLQSLAEIRQRLGVQFADSLTSREILRTTRLSPEARGALRKIIAAVEWTYFGGYPAAMGDYAACRSSFETLQRELRGGAA